MAVVATLVTPTVRLTPFTGLSETVREKSGIARAEEIHSAYGTWAATGAGDSRSISFTWDLDPTYGYILMDCNCIFLSNASYLKMGALGFMEIGTEFGVGGADIERQYYQLVSYPDRQNAAGDTALGSITMQEYNVQYPCVTATGAMTFSMVKTPTALLYPFPGVSNISIATVFSEEAEQEQGYSYRFYCRFLQYDIIQGYNYVVNSPIMTRG